MSATLCIIFLNSAVYSGMHHIITVKFVVCFLKFWSDFCYNSLEYSFAPQFLNMTVLWDCKWIAAFMLCSWFMRSEGETSWSSEIQIICFTLLNIEPWELCIFIILKIYCNLQNTEGLWVLIYILLIKWDSFIKAEQYFFLLSPFLKGFPRNYGDLRLKIKTLLNETSYTFHPCNEKSQTLLGTEIVKSYS